MTTDAIRRLVRRALIRIAFRDGERDYAHFVKERRFVLDMLPQLTADRWRRAKCAFVLSTGRTGTMQLAALLRCSQYVVAVHEPAPELLDVSRDAFGSVLADVSWQRLVHAARDEWVAYAAAKSCLYVETSNRMTFLARAIADAYPQSQFVFLHRHPHDVIRSAMTRHWYAGHPLDFSRPTPVRGDPLALDWDSRTPLEKNAWLWRATNRHCLDFLASLPNSRAFTLGAADLFAAKPDTIHSLHLFLGLPTPESRLITRVLGRPLNTSGGRHSAAVPWSRTEAAVINRIVGPIASELDYSLPDGAAC